MPLWAVPDCSVLIGSELFHSHSFFGNHKHTKCYLLNDALDPDFRYVKTSFKLEACALWVGM